MMRRQALLGACLLALIGAGCPSPPPQQAPRNGGVAVPTPTAQSADSSLRWAIGEPTAIVPIDAVTPDDLLVVDALYDSLTAWDERLQVVPSTAVRWTARRGGRVWRFALRRNATFHDGTPVTAQHFVDTWNVMASRGAAHHHLADVEGYQAVRDGSTDVLSGVRAVDTSTLEVRLRRPNYEWPAVAGHPALGPMPRPRAPNRVQPVGNGPFTLAEPWARERFLRLSRADEQSDGARPGRLLDEVVFQVMDAATAYLAFAQGRVDVASLPPGADDRSRFPVSTRYTGPGLLRGPLPATYLLVFDTSRPPFDDVNARRGIAMALDRTGMAQSAFAGQAGPARTLVPPVLPGARQRTCLACVFDPAGARRALRDAAVGEVALWVNRGGDHERVAARVQRDLDAAGVRVRVRAVGFERFRTAMTAEPGLFRFGWAPDYPTLDNALRPLLHSAATPQRGGANYSRYRNPDIDRLLDRAAATQDPAARVARYRRIEDLVIGRDQVVIPVVNPRRGTVVAERVRGLIYGPMGTANLEHVRVVERDVP
ncbi:MAG TPA: ABC transporter substrate-binding protein [Egibacteraceae bacterium]|nr:ABC transporter substrate-binding protein [Egibacteraceae bacterium]